MPNTFFWYDVMTTDTVAAAQFYGDVVGWGTQAAEQPGMPYTLFTVAGQPVAGLMLLPEDVSKAGGRPRWMGYVGVDDVDATAARLQSLGGAVHRPRVTMPGVIEFAVVADPHGAVFLIGKGLAEDPPPRPADGTPGTIGWRELYAGDGPAAFDFYEAMFGWTKSTAVDMGPMGTYQVFAINGADAGGIMTKPPMMPMAFWGFYFNVHAVDAAAERVKAGGGSITNGPMQVPGGQWIVQAMDPQGASFNLVALTR